ncbi:putative quinol monooxygenase [Streptomyces sp. NBC_01808]|uniref:putative quinol monooxygenase n=1 Tax=Streptomyces sp. NBC_01808 TaxID=2975947 RepID=UPI002DDB455C|nr:antibiotic biosynthesis monooxygenase family protein [Streptomyces sp. NBC_01808]
MGADAHDRGNGPPRGPRGHPPRTNRRRDGPLTGRRPPSVTAGGGGPRCGVRRRDDYLAGCANVVTQARTAAGCLDFALSPDPVEADRINVYERWETDEDVLRFRGTGPDADQSVRILDADVHKYRISGIEAP